MALELVDIVRGANLEPIVVETTHRNAISHFHERVLNANGQIPILALRQLIVHRAALISHLSVLALPLILALLAELISVAYIRVSQ